MSHARSLMIWALTAAVLGAGEARAWLESGTLLTNAASASYSWRGNGATVTYSATMKVLITTPAIFLTKDASPTYIAMPGGLVTYVVCFSNGGTSTAFNVTINDLMPNGTGAWWRGYATGWCVFCFSPHQGTGAWSGGGTPMASYSFDNVIWNPGTPAVGQQGPCYLRWVVPMLGIGHTGSISYVVSLG